MVMRNPAAPNPDFAETVRGFLMEMPIARHFGLSITGVGHGLFEITQPFRTELSFRPGIFQAGPVGTLADMAAACAGITLLPPGWAASTVDYTIKLLAPAAGEKLVARGRVVKSGRTLSVAASDVYAVSARNELLCATALVTIRNFEARSS
jgi:uncharacterized protein (TIGR00369 family)